MTGDSSRREDIRVVELIDDASRSWKVDLVHDLFDNNIAQAICSILVSKIGCPDKLIWHFETDETPNKIKAFLWRVYHNSMPVMIELARMHIPVSPICQRCKNSLETLEHALRGCPRALEVWRHLTFQWDNDIGGNSDFEARRFLKQGWSLAGEQIQQFIVTIWAIWNDRNGDLHGENHRPVHVTAKFVCNYLAEFNEANKRPPRTQQREQTHWKSPQYSELKVNFDGAFISTSNKGGIGVIIRNDIGEWGLGELSSKVMLLMWRTKLTHLQLTSLKWEPL
ncbi:hypothetical protein PTKIN_Ptkin19aG0080700 [Pterospermum kingtungense]